MALFPNETAALAQGALQTLQDRLQGTVILPGDVDYDAARMAWNLAFEQYPPVIVMAETADDVAAAVRFARAEGMDIAVQATGHGFTRAANHALLINMSRMTHVEVDAEAQTAWVEGGAKWQPVLDKAQAVGLVPLLGSTPDVGAVGYTLGGGVGWLARKYGLSADSVNAFEVVTAQGRIVWASEYENSDLFWALRGGGGSFGVITGMEIRLYPVTTVYAGNLYYPAAMAKEVMTRFREWIATTPEELTSSVVLMNYPPIPEVPEPLRGQSFVQVRGAYTGLMEDGEELLKYWREWKAPAMDMFGPLPLTRAAEISNDPPNPTSALVTGVWLKDLSDEAIDTIIRFGLAPHGVTVSEIRHVGDGAISRVDKRANAYGNREASLVLEIIGIAPTPELWQAADAYAREYKRALAGSLTGGVYINFLEGDERQDRTKDAFTAENYQRLMAIKAKYDPQNVFSHSFHIPPAADDHA
ncbi:MAG: FAD-binding oxidoreductase [Anaerolineae bacterium]|nr:FAD-binding oxidoreductase [Anaerolineae bacterium]